MQGRKTQITKQELLFYSTEAQYSTYIFPPAVSNRDLQNTLKPGTFALALPAKKRQWLPSVTSYM